MVRTAQACILTAAVLALVVAASGVGASVGKKITLGSRGLELAFAVSGERLALVELAGAGPQWLGEFPKDASLWMLAFQGPGGAAKDLGSAEAKLTRAEGGGSRASFEWDAPLSESAAAKVKMSVRIAGKGSMSYWSLSAKLPLGWKVARADFPILPNIRLDAARKMAVPTGWGLEYDMKPGAAYDGAYPSVQAVMQFLAFYGDGHGLYLGMHDPRGCHKLLSVKAGALRQAQDEVAFYCTNWPALPEKGGGVYKVPFEAAIGAFTGGYHDAAQIYREFTYKTVWGKGGALSKRSVPQWLKDIDLWLMPAADPLANVEACKKAADYYGVPIGLHWYNWHKIPFDTLYPDYFPAKRNFTEGVKALRDAGFHVMPYINGRLADPKSRFWTDGHAEKSAAKQPNGELYTEVYGSKVPLKTMCPYSAQWQEEIDGTVDRLVNECGVNGVYIDQIGAAYPVLCHDATHGHLLGGGSMWVDGYRKMLDVARKKLPKDAILTTEENAECWIDQLDALLMANTPSGEPRLIPLFPAVYSGRAITFGFQYIAGDDIAKSLPWRAKMARAFVWGSQLGWTWMDGGIMAPSAVKEAEFLRNLARCRRFGHRFVVTGRFLGMVECRGDNPHVTGDIDLPSVIASSWLAEDGTYGVLLANMSDEPREVEFDTPVSGKRYAVETFNPEGRLSSTRSESSTQKVKVPARSAAMLRWSGAQVPGDYGSKK